MWLKRLLAIFLLTALPSIRIALAEDDQEDGRWHAPTDAVYAVLNYCAPNDMTVSILAENLGLSEIKRHASFSWALPTDARSWDLGDDDVQTVLYAYGPDLRHCGVVLRDPARRAVMERIESEFLSQGAFARDHSGEISSSAHFVRLQNEGDGRMIDVIQYRSGTGTTSLVKIELLN